MPSYTITSPEGKSYTIEGDNPSEIEDYLNENFNHPPDNNQNSPPSSAQQLPLKPLSGGLSSLPLETWQSSAQEVVYGMPVMKSVLILFLLILLFHKRKKYG